MYKNCPHVLLGGGTGFIGKGINYLLKEKGYNVTIISRKGGHKRITWFDICSSGLPDGITAVINVAGQNILDIKKRWNENFKNEVWKSRVDTTLTLTKAVFNAEKKPKVFINISGVGIYKPDDKIVYNEYSPFSPSFDYLSHLVIEWENASILPLDTEIRCVTIRSGVVLGRHGGIIKKLYTPFYLGLGGPIGCGNQPFPWIHLKDICKMFVQSIEDDKFSGIYNGVAPQLINNYEFTKAFGAALKRPTFVRVPKIILNTIFGKERASIMTEGQKVEPQRVIEAGFNYEYPDIKSALNAIVQRHKRNRPF